MVTIDNGLLRVCISPVGAELQSVRRLGTGHEYLWQGEAAIWPRRSPLLFPIVGRLKGDAYLHEGKRYALEKHGFAQDAVFKTVETSGARAAFVLEEEAGVRKGYPFAYRLTVCYALEWNTLAISHTVENTGEQAMYFSIGAHPGFCCSMGDALVFEREEALNPYRLTEAMLLSGTPGPPCGTGRIIITPELFAQDALIFKGLASRAVRLARRDGKGDVAVRYGDAPCLGIWAKPGAPYVCIEPWFGVDDHAEVSGELRDKPNIQMLAPGDRFDFPVSIMMEG